MTESATISTHEATERDIPEILEVLASSLGETRLLRRTSDLFDWKHTSNPFGRSLVLVARSADRIVGVRAFMRWVLETPEGESLQCMRAVDTSTHPDFQGQGIFRNLTMAAVEKARDQGVHLIFNTPNEKSAPGYLKMGWREIGWLGPMVRVRVGRATRPSEEAETALQTALPTVSAPTAWSGERRRPLGLRTPRTEDYQRWRYGGHPTARYGWFPNDDGGAFVRASERWRQAELRVVDLFADARGLRSLVRSTRARYLVAHFAPNTPEWRAARRSGFVPAPGVKGLRLVANPLTDLDFDVFDLSSWDLSLGDLELL